MDRFVDVGGAKLAVSVEGPWTGRGDGPDGGPDSGFDEGPADAPTLLLLHSIGTTREMWLHQRRTLRGLFRVITYDVRGHGASGAPLGDYTLADLGQDALAVLDAAGTDAAHVCGLSLGGITAMWMALHAPARVRTLTLANTAARIGTAQLWAHRIAFVREHGMAAIAERSMPVWFSQGFRARDPEAIERFKVGLAACSLDGYLGCCAALRDADLRDALGAIGCPTTVIAGSHDASTPVVAAESIRDAIEGARLITLDAAHLSNIEQPEAFTAVILELLAPRRVPIDA